MCGQQFSHGEARFQQVGNVHAHCVNGGIGRDLELHPQQPFDQEAVEAVSRQRETIIRAAADTEVLLPFAQDPDQDSTTSSGSTTSRGTASRTYVAPRTFNHRLGPSLRCSKHNMRSSVQSCTTTPPHWPLSHLGKLLCSAAGSGTACCQGVGKQLCSLLGCQT